ncbi:MAG: elongation factor 1-beta family protein [Nanoarchaeota archaeon]
MTNLVITIKIMPEIEADLTKIKEEAEKKLKKLNAYIGKAEIIPVAFGLKSINLTFTINEVVNSDDIENSIKNIKGVQSLEIVDVRRAIG